MKNNKGFTLIELLVVIAIIGILSAVVLASLNTARNKGSDAAVKANLAQVRSSAAIEGGDTANYTTLCAASTNSKAQYDAAVSAGGNGGLCAGTSSGWVAWAGLKADTAKAFCVDNTGTAKEITKPTGAITVCP